MDEEVIVEQPITDAPVETQVETEITPEVEQVVTEETKVEPAQEIKTTEEKVEETEVEPTAITVEGVEFGDTTVNVTVPAELTQMATDKGFDAKELATELFSSKDFKFSDETYGKLCDAYGKIFVDTMISNTQLKAEKVTSDFTNSIKEAEAKAFEAVSSIVGGEEGWSKMEAFAGTQSEDAIQDFNAAMQSGNPVFQRLAVQNMKMLMDASAPHDLELIDGKGVVTQAPTALSAQEYRDAMSSGEYYKDPAKYDALRRAGMQQGI